MGGLFDLPRSSSPQSADEPKTEPACSLPVIGARDCTRLIRSVLVDDNMGAGIQSSGVSGCGKTSVSETIEDISLGLGIAVTKFDSHGDSAESDIQRLGALPRSKRSKILYWKAADPHRTTGVHPLKQPNDPNLTQYERDAIGRIRVELTANVILSMFNEAGFGSRPVLRKWVTRWLWTLYQSGMTFADVLMLLDPLNSVYQLLMQIVPDAMARNQMIALSGMKVADLEAEIGSARNRIMAVLEHPAALAFFSKRDNVLDFEWMYHNDVSLILNLEKGNLLTDDLQRLLCNVVLMQQLAVILATPTAKRRPRLIIIDELPIFIESSGRLICSMCTQIRKFRTKFVLCHQGSSGFPGRLDNELLHTITDQCRVHFFFRHGLDAEFFGKQVSMAAWSSRPKVKHIHKTPQQFNEGVEIIELTDRSEGTAEQTGSSSTDGTTDQVTDTLSRAVQNIRHPVGTQLNEQRQTDGDSSARGHANQHSSTQTQSTTRNASRTVKQVTVPKIVTKMIVQSIEHYKTEEIDRSFAATMRQFDTGECFLQLDGIGAYIVRKTPLPHNPYAMTPRFAARKAREWIEEILRRPEFDSPQHIRAEHERFVEELVIRLQAMALEQQHGKGLPGHQVSDQPPPSANKDNLIILPDDPDNPMLGI